MPDVTDTTSNPLISSIFWGDPTGQGMTYEQLKARRALAAALAAKSRDYPNTIGKGIFSAAESISEGIRDSRLDAQEKALRAGDATAVKERLAPLTGNRPAMEPPPPVRAPGPAAGTSGPRAELDPEVDLSRAQMAEALMGGAQGSMPPQGPAPIRMAALPSASTMSDAGQPGATYGGPAPAGPGASMAEPPDQSMPAPPASPPVAPAGPGPVGTPAPAPATGGGVPPGPMSQGGPMAGPPPGAMPPQGSPMGANRDMLAAAVEANRGFNPDAAAAGPGAGIPPQMVAQVGGFSSGFGGGEPVPETAPQQNRPGPQYGPGGRPVVPQEFVPLTEADRAKQYGAAVKPPEAWPAADKANYQKAIAESMDPYRSDAYRARAAAVAEDIVKNNQARFSTAHEDYRLKQTQEREQLKQMNDELRQRNKDLNDPEVVAKKELAESNLRIVRKTGMPAEEVHKNMEAELEATRKAMRKQEDNQLVLQAIRDGVIAGTLADYRKQGAKVAGWAFGSEYMRQKGINTETMISRLNAGISEAVKDLKPVSGYETKIGQASSGADINLEKETIENITKQSIQRNNEQIARYDTNAQRIYGGERQAKQFESPSLNWVPKGDVELLSRNAADPATLQRHIGHFNQIYGPGSAETVLNRIQQRGGKL